MSNYKELKELPISLSAGDISDVLGVSRGRAYQLMDTPGFPLLKIGKRKIVLKNEFMEWLEEQRGTAM